ncbi:MAG: glycoside hydrolase [Candidatus Sumerlaeia bacterium]|nr:glycoside hydrolase [Candidatus Sumerlaeia bacterium]
MMRRKGLQTAGLIVLALRAGTLTAAQAADSARNYVTIFRDAGAGGYEAFPDLCRMPNGELLCVFYAGFAHVSLPSYGPQGKLPPECPNAGRICLTRSRDNGKTWSPPTVVIDTPLDDRDPSIARLPDGTLLCNYFAHQPGKSGRGYQFVHSALVRSSDGGRTWSAEQPLFNQWACSSPIRRLSDGRLALPLYLAVPSRAKGEGYGGISFSTDAGRTWSDPVPIGKDGPIKLAAEPDIVELPDGTLLAGLRAALGERSAAFARSRDGGRTWSKPEPMGFLAQSIYFLLTRKGILLMGHRLPGTSLHYSLDGGKTWSDNVQLAPSGGAYPSMVELPDGSIYCVYYEEGPQSDIRGMRFTVDPSGVRVLPPETW